MEDAVDQIKIQCDQSTWPSVDEIAPSEEGGSIARSGFNYQDEVAVSLLLAMFDDTSIVKIHCETHDDIVLVREVSGIKHAEYIQVKASQPDKLWSISDLCQRKAAKAGTSIFEKSLARDAHKELSQFRILTLRPVVSGLEVLTLPLGAVGRESGCGALQKLCDELEERFPGLTSPKGNGCSHWLENCLWDVRHDEQAIRVSNRMRVMQIASKQGTPLLNEHVDVILDELRAWASKAGAAKWVPDRDKKIITSDTLRKWWDSKIAEITAIEPSGGNLVRKMGAAGLPNDVVALAVDLRRTYAEQLRTTRYEEPDERQRLLELVKAEAMSLRSRYVAGEINITSEAFYALCIDRMKLINAERPRGSADCSAFLQGCLFDIADRCLIRFDRASH